MKEKRWLRILLPLLLCASVLSALLSACATPAPEDSSAPAEESSEAVPVAEDENAKTVRAYLEELLEEGWSAEWLTEERAETIRESVKALKTPILTEEDVLRIAERAAAFYFAAWQGKREILLPPCGVLGLVRRVPERFSLYSEHEGAYNALLAYTLYLFTPSNYIFWGSEIWNAGEFIFSGTGLDPAYALCFPFAGDYTNRSGALNAIREQRSCVRLYPSVSNGERPLDFSYCGTADRLQGGECTTLDLMQMAGQEDISEEFNVLYAKAFAEEWFGRVVYDWGSGEYVDYFLPNGDVIVAVYQPFTAEQAQEIREKVEMLPEPFLTEEMVEMMREFVYGYPMLLFPGLDGAEDLLLPPGIESLEESLWLSEPALAAMSRGATAYLLDLFTPAAYRYSDLFTIKGAYYALDGETERYALVAEEYLPGTIGIELLRVEETVEERTE